MDWIVIILIVLVAVVAIALIATAMKRKKDEVARGADAATDDHQRGVEHRGEAGETLAGPPADALEELDGGRVTAEVLRQRVRRREQLDGRRHLTLAPDGASEVLEHGRVAPEAARERPARRPQVLAARTGGPLQ